MNKLKPAKIENSFVLKFVIKNTPIKSSEPISNLAVIDARDQPTKPVSTIAISNISIGYNFTKAERTKKAPTKTDIILKR